MVYLFVYPHPALSIHLVLVKVKLWFDKILLALIESLYIRYLSNRKWKPVNMYENAIVATYQVYLF